MSHNYNTNSLINFNMHSSKQNNILYPHLAGNIFVLSRLIIIVSPNYWLTIQKTFRTQYKLIIQLKMDKLMCPICTGNLQLPKMCPHCSQVFCEQCITTYLAEKHFCPTCDNYIIDLVDCGRLVEELEQVVHAKKNSNGSPKLCNLHNLQLAYYCKDCSKWICSDCGVIDAAHRRHSILNKAQAFLSNKEHFNKQLVKLSERIYKLNIKKQKCMMDLEVYRTQLKWSRAKIQKYCQQLMARVDNEGEKQIGELLQKIKEYEKSLQNLKKKHQELEKIIQSQVLSPSKLQAINNKPAINGLNIDIFPHNSKDVSEQEQESNLFFNKVRKIKVIEQIFPNFTYFTYEFDYQNLKQDTFHYSDYFEVWGQDWRLKIYPNGNSGVVGKYLSVFLELANGHNLEKAKKYVYKIELLSLNRAGSTIVKQYCSVFDSGQSWGYSDYLNLNCINEYLHEGRLLFSIGIRNETYEGLCCDLKKYIVKIENENKILEKLLCDSAFEASVPQSSRTSKIRQYSQMHSESEIKIDQPSDIEVSIVIS